ncbi:DUF1190 domain-containing protein [Methylobacterium sp. 17Sr1-1]|uniref:DUF1190 domain-containing protein n=1 Tax=Methylobacterium sp. 17Sr1-1 TaxID=2202826 RepID=UPI000D6F5921|nr:DUF1190 domain-containing protein [Methylobacterium sp. 17Sr1-1]AWN52901.1 hypothetical protein DK412_15785 [Methylobacterium sp. 17Sr1-1]
MSEVAPVSPEETARRAKRSAAISLVLVAGAGAGAFALAGLAGAKRDEDVLVYRTLDACLAERVRSAQACTEAEAAARAAHAASAPRYETLAECERHHGSGGCVPGATVTPDAQGRTLPLMSAFMMGRTDEQNLPVQPLYAHAPAEERSHAGHGGGYAGGYCTGSGARVVPGGGGSGARVSSAVARSPVSTPRTIARGGFGGTGRAVAAASSGHGTGGG